MNNSTQQKTNEAPLILLYGLDERQKPRAASFTGERPELVTKAAAAMNLTVCEARTPPLVEVANKLPKGRLYSNGRGFVPNVRKELFDKLIVAATLSQGASLPRSCDEIGIGHLVLVQEATEDGWWEGIVTERSGDVLTVRYRDYPDNKSLQRHVHAVALLHPATE